MTPGWSAAACSNSLARGGITLLPTPSPSAHNHPNKQQGLPLQVLWERTRLSPCSPEYAGPLLTAAGSRAAGVSSFQIIENFRALTLSGWCTPCGGHALSSKTLIGTPNHECYVRIEHMTTDVKSLQAGNYVLYGVCYSWSANVRHVIGGHLHAYAPRR
jgi:hypothetical protein